MLAEIFRKISGKAAAIDWNDSLRTAAADGDAVRVAQALAAGAQPDTAGADGLTALYHAAKSGYTAVVAALIAAGATVNTGKPGDIEGTPLVQAAMGGHTDTVLLLMDNGAAHDQTGYERRTALHVALYLGNETLAARLLDYKLDVNTEDRQGNSPLHDAMTHCSEGICIRLVQLGAATDVNDRWGAPARDRAIAKDMKALVQAIDDERDRPAREAAAAAAAARALADEIREVAVLKTDVHILKPLQFRTRQP